MSTNHTFCVLQTLTDGAEPAMRNEDSIVNEVLGITASNASEAAAGIDEKYFEAMSRLQSKHSLLESSDYDDSNNISLARK